MNYAMRFHVLGKLFSTSSMPLLSVMYFNGKKRFRHLRFM